MSKNLIARLAVAVVAIPTILWICYQGGVWLFGMIALFAVLGMIEFLWAEKIRPNDLMFWFALVTVGAVLFFVFQGGAVADRIDPTGWYASVIGLILPVFFFSTSTSASSMRRFQEMPFPLNISLVTMDAAANWLLIAPISEGLEICPI